MPLPVLRSHTHTPGRSVKTGARVRRFPGCNYSNLASSNHYVRTIGVPIAVMNRHRPKRHTCSNQPYDGPQDAAVEAGGRSSCGSACSANERLSSYGAQSPTYSHCLFD